MMMWFSLVVFSLICYGASNQFIYSPGPFGIWDSVRYVGNKIHHSIGYLLTCMKCLPTWVGIILSLIDLYLYTDLNFTPGNLLLNGDGWLLILLIDGSIASGISFIIFSIQNWFLSNSKDDEEIEMDISDIIKHPDLDNKIKDVINKKDILND